jgi:uncharacterized membrane protein YphA (DoxX/SURF4 family)
VADDNGTLRWFGTRVEPALRIGSAALLLGPGVGKFISYEHSVQFFTTLGLPVPEMSVPVVGAIELGAAGLLFMNRVAWLGAVVVLPVMAVAVATAGPTWQNLGAFFAACIVLANEAYETNSETRKHR